jgi:hypothetical protein
MKEYRVTSWTDGSPTIRTGDIVILDGVEYRAELVCDARYDFQRNILTLDDYAVYRVRLRLSSDTEPMASAGAEPDD